MADMMTFPKTLDEFMEQYKIVDTEQVYTNGTDLVPIFRIKQWEDAHQQKTATEKQKAYAKYLVQLRKLIDGEEKRCFPPDYIDRRKLTAEMMELIPTRLYTEEDMLDLVNEQPRADVVEVVRCRNCCHSQYDEEHDWYLCYANFCTMHNGDFYCAAGYPKEKTNE